MRLQRGVGRAAHPVAYLWQVARNEARRTLKRRGRRWAREVGEAPLEVLPDAANPGVSRTVRLAVAEGLRELPLEQREAVALIAFEGLSARQAAERLAIPTDTAASRYRLAVEKLRRRLGGERRER